MPFGWKYVIEPFLHFMNASKRNSPTGASVSCFDMRHSKCTRKGLKLRKEFKRPFQYWRLEIAISWGDSFKCSILSQVYEAWLLWVIWPAAYTNPHIFQYVFIQRQLFCNTPSVQWNEQKYITISMYLLSLISYQWHRDWSLELIVLSKAPNIRRIEVNGMMEKITDT